MEKCARSEEATWLCLLSRDALPALWYSEAARYSQRKTFAESAVQTTNTTVSAMISPTCADHASPLQIPSSVKGEARFAQLFFDVTAKNAAQRCSTFLLPHFGQVTSPFSYSASVRTFVNSFWQAWQK